jgi:hypothetical protein
MATAFRPAPSAVAEQVLPSRNRLLITFGCVFFLVAATLVIVAQNLVRRPDTAIMIPAGQ